MLKSKLYIHFNTMITADQKLPNGLSPHITIIAIRNFLIKTVTVTYIYQNKSILLIKMQYKIKIIIFAFVSSSRLLLHSQNIASMGSFIFICIVSYMRGKFTLLLSRTHTY